MYWVIGPITVRWHYRWSVGIHLPEFVQWFRCSSGIRAICWCLLFLGRPFICKRVSLIHDPCIMRVIRWAAGETSSFKSLNFIQLILCRSCSEGGCLNLFRFFPLQVSMLQFCFSDLLVYLNCSTFPLSSIFFYSSLVFCFCSDFPLDSFRWFWVWSYKLADHIFCVPTLVWSGSALHYGATHSGIICEVFCLFFM